MFTHFETMSDVMQTVVALVVALAFVGVWITLERLGDRAFAVLPDDVKRHGLIGLLWRRLRGKPRNRSDT